MVLKMEREKARGVWGGGQKKKKKVQFTTCLFS